MRLEFVEADGREMTGFQAVGCQAGMPDSRDMFKGTTISRGPVMTM